MSVLNAVFIYFLIWWVMLFTVLPLDIERHGEDGKGYDAGAPRQAQIKKKLAINTVLSGVVLAIFVILVNTGVIDWAALLEGKK